MSDWRFYRHMPVYLANGRRLGWTEEIAHAADMLHVRQGRVLVRDWYVPATAIQSADPGGVRLGVHRSDLRANRWNVPPLTYLMQQGATPGYEYTSPSDARTYVEEGLTAEETG